jgi:hypothetical protein
MASSRLSMVLAWSLAVAAFGQTSTLDGVRRSQGYGLVFEIKGSTLRAFEVTSTTCVPGFTAEMDAARIAGREATFKREDGDDFFIRTGGSNDHRILHNEGSASDVRIDRLILTV